MVKYKTILNVIEKCLSKKRILEKLSEIDDVDKHLMLKPLTNPGELEEYDKLKFTHALTLSRLDSLKDDLKNGYLPENIANEAISEMKRKSENEEKRIYYYEKRIYDTKFKLREPKKIDYDLTNFKEDPQITDNDELFEDTSIGPVERGIIEQQENIVFTDKQLSSIHSYYGSGSRILNSKLYDGESWNRLSENDKERMGPSIDKRSRNLTLAINSTEGIKDNIIVYHGGPFDPTKIPGDHIKLKGFTSCSFQKKQGESFGGIWCYKICLPTGSKGLCGNAVATDSKGKTISLSSHTDEHELLLNKDFGCNILDVDYENHIVTVIP